MAPAEGAKYPIVDMVRQSVARIASEAVPAGRKRWIRVRIDGEGNVAGPVVQAVWSSSEVTAPPPEVVAQICCFDSSQMSEDQIFLEILSVSADQAWRIAGHAYLEWVRELAQQPQAKATIN